MTLKQIAKALNVSVATVSRVANNKENVAPQTRKTILEAMAKYGYTPNEVARSLKSNTTGLVGLVVDSLKECASSVKVVTDILLENGYSTILCITEGNAQKEIQCLNMLFKRHVDALLMYTLKSSGYEKFSDASIPVVHVGKISEEEIDTLEADNIEGAKLATSHIIAKWNRKIGIITQNPPKGRELLIGYKTALEEKEIEVEDRYIKHCNNTFEEGYSAMMQLLGEDIDAVFVTEKQASKGALFALNQHHNKEKIYFVGKDLDNTTQTYIDTSSLAKGACEIILNKLTKKQQRRIQQKIIPYLAERES